MTRNVTPHYHLGRDGILHRCWHRCRGSLSSWQFWAGMTLGFPFEHMLWERAWPFYLITKALGL